MRSSEEGAHDEGPLPDVDRIDHIGRLLIGRLIITAMLLLLLLVIDDNEIRR